METLMKTPVDRFAEKFVVSNEGCWPWQGVRRNGYGQFRVGSRMVSAHRFIYGAVVEVVPDDLNLDHLCHTRDLACPGGPTCPHRRCVNPDHLEPVTAGENARRGKTGAHMKARTHCPSNHPYDEVNTYIRPNGARNCRQCDANQKRDRRSQKVA